MKTYQEGLKYYGEINNNKFFELGTFLSYAYAKYVKKNSIFKDMNKLFFHTSLNGIEAKHGFKHLLLNLTLNQNLKKKIEEEDKKILEDIKNQFEENELITGREKEFIKGNMIIF